MAVDLRPHHDQLVGIWIGQRRKQGPIDDAENRRIRADSESERKECHGGESEVPAEQPEAKVEIADNIPHTLSPFL